MTDGSWNAGCLSQPVTRRPGREKTLKNCPRCGRPVDAEITILRSTGTELAYAHYCEDGAVDMCHSDEIDLPRPYVYDEATQTVYGVTAARDDREAV
jgi:hypothetical protein